MLNFLKKKEESKPTIEPQPKVFEANKEITFRDEKTGEFIYQRPLTPEHRQAIMRIMGQNSQLANQFIQLNRNRLSLDSQINNISKAIIDSEKEIGDIVNKVRDELKLDRRWGLNPNLGVLERKDPPG